MILIVHEEAALLLQAKKALSFKHTVICVTDLQDAIDVTNTSTCGNSLDLILSSFHIQSSRNSLTVFDFLKSVRSNPKIKSVPFVMVCFEPDKLGSKLRDSIGTAGKLLGASGYIMLQKFERVSSCLLLKDPAMLRFQTLSSKNADLTGEVHYSWRCCRPYFCRIFGVDQVRKNRLGVIIRCA